MSNPGRIPRGYDTVLRGLSDGKTIRIYRCQGLPIKSRSPEHIRQTGDLVAIGYRRGSRIKWHRHMGRNRPGQEDLWERVQIQIV